MSQSVWTDFLAQQGVILNADGATGSAGADNGRLQLTPLQDQCVLELNGPDGVKFLQGQTTCDMKLLSAQQSLQGANCTPKGIMISFFRLLSAADESILIRLARSNAEAALANLAKYIVFSKAKIGIAEQYIGLGIQGENAPEQLARLWGEIPAEPGQQRRLENAVLVRVPASQPRFELWMHIDAAAQYWSQLIDCGQLAQPAAWLQAEIMAGIPQFSDASLDNLIPQMLNLQAIDAISFNKGCYTGQEVVARLQHRGVLKRYLQSAEVSCTQQPQIGDSLHTPARRSVGKVLAVAALADNRFLLQVVINVKESTGDIRLHEQDGPAVTLIALPYSIDPAMFER